MPEFQRSVVTFSLIGRKFVQTCFTSATAVRSKTWELAVGIERPLNLLQARKLVAEDPKQTVALCNRLLEQLPATASESEVSGLIAIDYPGTQSELNFRPCYLIIQGR